MCSDRGKAIKLVLLILLLSGILWIGSRFSYENPPESQIERKNEALEGTLPIIQNNTLLPIISKSVVRSIIISEPDYCGIDYLSNFWTKDLVDIASRICYCESGGSYELVNDSSWGVVEYSVGLFQINTLVHTQYNEEWLKVPENNVKAAIEIYNNGKEWSNWFNCFKNTKL